MVPRKKQLPAPSPMDREFAVQQQSSRGTKYLENKEYRFEKYLMTIVDTDKPAQQGKVLATEGY